MQLIDGKVISQQIYSDLADKLKKLPNSPKLAIILASNDEASQMYIKMKSEKAKRLGIETEVFLMDNKSKDEVINQIDQINKDSSFNGILVQLPLNEALKEHTKEILNHIREDKDVDGLRDGGRKPATVEAIIECLLFTTYEPLDSYLKDKNVAIINDSDLIGKPLSIELQRYGARVNVLNKYTADIKSFTSKADIVVSATGVGQIFDHTFVKENCTVIDVTSIKKNDKVVGDFVVDDLLNAKVSFITPVPGGVGPLTIACLLRNLVESALNQSIPR